ncbi:MAG: NAD(P)H-dependent glycerol-3-phosphate dehydrogenase [Acidobacteriota bacterium]
MAVLGAGSWGTALAQHLARRGNRVHLLFRNPDAAQQSAAERENKPYLPGVQLDRGLIPTADPDEALRGAQLVLVVTPVKGLGLAATWLEDRARPEIPVVSCAKGLTPASLETPLMILARSLPDRRHHLAVLSGPSFARELAREHPTAAVVAAHDPGLARQVQSLMTGGAFRLYTNDDPRGVELAGALKNVIALAAGMVDGLGYGSNTAAALMTRGLTEITRLGVALGGAPSTFAGLAGMGDLVLTCTGRASRNRQVGRDLAQGHSLREILSRTPMVAEGVPTTRAAARLGGRMGVELPIAEQMEAILFQGRSPRRALEVLLARDPREEDRFEVP